MTDKILITGLGLWTSLGENVHDTWKSLTSHSSPAGGGRGGPKGGEGTSRHFLPPHRHPLPQRGRGINEIGFCAARTMAKAACREALADAGLWDGHKIQGVDLDRLGCAVSASKPFFNNDDASVLPPESLLEALRDHFSIQGECRNVIAACATGAYAIALAAGWIESGLCDVVLAGSAEPWPHPLVEAGFRKMGVISEEAVMRPFDRRRSGFVFGAGAGVVALESESHWQKRNSGRPGRRLAGEAAHRDGSERKFFEKNTTPRSSGEPPLRLAASPVSRLSIFSRGPYARLSGWGLGSDAHSAVAFNSNGQHIADVIGRALGRAGLQTSDVSYVHAHGTATHLNDWIETQALMKAFDSHAPNLMVSATKASTGHMLGAAGSAGFIFSVLALKNQFIPPTATLEENDPECPLDYTPGLGHAARFEHAMSLSFGFGGPIGALVVSR